MSPSTHLSLIRYICSISVSCRPGVLRIHLLITFTATALVSLLGLENSLLLSVALSIGAKVILLSLCSKILQGFHYSVEAKIFSVTCRASRTWSSFTSRRPRLLLFPIPPAPVVSPAQTGQATPRAGFSLTLPEMLFFRSVPGPHSDPSLRSLIRHSLLRRPSQSPCSKV